MGGSQHLQKQLLGIIEIKAHRFVSRQLVAFGQPIMDASVTGQPRRLETRLIGCGAKHQSQLCDHISKELIQQRTAHQTNDVLMERQPMSTDRTPVLTLPSQIRRLECFEHPV